MDYFGQLLRSTAGAAPNNSSTSPLRRSRISALAPPFNSINASPIQRPRPGQSSSLLPTVLATFFGAETLQIAYADANNEAENPYIHSPPPPCDIANYVNTCIYNLLKNKGLKLGSYPHFTVTSMGPKVSIQFKIPPGCEVSHLIANLASNLGMKGDASGGGSVMLLHASNSILCWKLTLNHPASQKESGGDQGKSTKINTPEGDLCVLLSRSHIQPDEAKIEFIKSGSLSTSELNALVSVLELAGGKLKTLESKPGEGDARMPSTEKCVASLKSMGVRVFGLDEPNLNSSTNDISLEDIAGYDQQKREIDETILWPLRYPELYDKIAHATREKFESNRPRAVLFEGPPGTGKTSFARAIANKAGVPLLNVPQEAVVSKYYGESERSLENVFSLARELPNGAIIFLDEVDSFAGARGSKMHEATRRILSVLLRKVDGFEQDKKVVVIAATNRKQDLDPALISRFEPILFFGLPDYHDRQKIAARYAKQLTKSELEELAQVTEGMSGRDIYGVCKGAERSWGRKRSLAKESKDGELGNFPTLPEYTESVKRRRNALVTNVSN